MYVKNNNKNRFFFCNIILLDIIYCHWNGSKKQINYRTNNFQKSWEITIILSLLYLFLFHATSNIFWIKCEIIWNAIGNKNLINFLNEFSCKWVKIYWDDLLLLFQWSLRQNYALYKIYHYRKYNINCQVLKEVTT